MATDEIKNLRYCYDVLRRRIEDGDEAAAYWELYARVVTYFLRRYDPKFDTVDWHYDKQLGDEEAQELLTSHALLQRPKAVAEGFTKLPKDAEEELKKRVAKYFAHLA